jgi:hypothetical protein
MGRANLKNYISVIEKLSKITDGFRGKKYRFNSHFVALKKVIDKKHSQTTNLILGKECLYFYIAAIITCICVGLHVPTITYFSNTKAPVLSDQGFIIQD